MRPTGATRGRINCGSTILITVNKSTNKTNYKRPQWCCAKTRSTAGKEKKGMPINKWLDNTMDDRKEYNITSDVT